MKLLFYEMCPMGIILHILIYQLIIPQFTPRVFVYSNTELIVFS